MTKVTPQLRILIPDSTTNYILNPSVRYDSTGWTAQGSTISRVLDYARFGIASLKVVLAGSVVREGTYYRVTGLLGIKDPITVSAYVRGTGKVQIRLTNGLAGQQWTSKPIFLSSSRWKRIEVTGRSNGTNDVRLYVESAEPTAKALTFYVDGAQMERKSYSTTYCLSPETLVNSKLGTKRLGDVFIGDELLNEFGEYNEVVNAWPVRTKSYKITLENGTHITASGDHRFSCTRYVSGYSGKWNWKFEKTEDLNVGDYLQLFTLPSVPKRDKTLKDISFAYLFGYLLGDGYFCSNTSRNQPLIGWTFGKDEMEMAKIVERKYQDVFSFEKRSKYPTVKKSSPTELVLTTQDRTVANIFREADFPSDCTASQKYIPDSVYEYSKQELMAFLAGMIDSDGCVDLRGNLHIDSSSREIISQLHSIFSTKLGVHGWFGEYKDMSNFTGGERTSYRLSFKMADVKFLSDNGLVLSHPRKVKRMELATGDKRRRSAKIVSIEEVGVTDLIDITLSPGHTFIANGVVTHNCDGDQAGCRWNIIQAASVSTRDPSTREGGRWITLIGKERENEDLYMTLMGGLGMAPIVNHTQSFAVAPGGYFQSSKITERIITMTFHAKHVDLLGKDKTITLTYLHKLRQFLIDTIKPDLTAGDQDFLLEYLDGDTPLYFRARYDGGLEGEWDIRNKFFNSFPLRLLVVSPMIYEDDQEMATLDFQESFALNGAAARVDGRWNNMNFGFFRSSSAVDGGVGDLEIGRKGEIYAGGSMTQANYNALAVDPIIPANYIVYWDGTQWQKLSTSTNGFINDVAIAPNGDIYVTGAFTSIGGTSANRIAKWNGSAWSALGTGLAGGDGIHISIAPNGDLYVGGAFTSAGGNNAYRIAKWNGSSWSAIGLYGGFKDGEVNSIAISPDGTFMYVGGSFTDQFSIATNSMLKIAMYTVSTNSFVQVGSGFGGGSVLEVLISPSGVVYACGSFTASGTTVCSYIAQLIGSAWAPLGSGMNATVNSFDVGVNGDLIAVGSFTAASGIPCRGVALWNGSSWVNLDILIGIGKATISPLAVQFAPNGDVYIGGTSFSIAGAVVSQSQVSGITTVNNSGSAEVSPFVYVQGPGLLKWLENQTTKKRIFLNMQVLQGEEVFFDFGRGTVESTVRGSLLSFILPGSDFNAFTLIPGDNKIAMLITQDVGAVVKMGYTPAHWGADVSK